LALTSFLILASVSFVQELSCRSCHVSAIAASSISIL
jgi:hypothetical protein